MTQVELFILLSAHIVLQSLFLPNLVKTSNKVLSTVLTRDDETRVTIDRTIFLTSIFSRAQVMLFVLQSIAIGFAV